MANQEHLNILSHGVEAWNKWRAASHNLMVTTNNLRLKIDSEEISLSQSAPVEFNPDLREADLSGMDLKKIDLHKATLIGVNLNGSDLMGANLKGADLRNADLMGANLRKAKLKKADFTEADLMKANLMGANLHEADLRGARLVGANLRGAVLSQANLFDADLSQADLGQAFLFGADLRRAILTQANLIEADLSEAILVDTQIDKANISGSLVYGVNVWDLQGEFEEQKDLVITAGDDPVITVDNIKIAQFIYLIVNNEEIRDVINTLTSKAVLILGRFTPERKAVLDALRNKLREYDLLPIVFDFERSENRDFTETIKTLAGLAYFVIADLTNPKSSPLELQATIPNYQIPFVPIIQEGEKPFAMMVDLQNKYPWVLDTLSYNSIETLIKALKPAIIDLAIKKHNELRLIKAREPRLRSANDFLDQGRD